MRHVRTLLPLAPFASFLVAPFALACSGAATTDHPAEVADDAGTASDAWVRPADPERLVHPVATSADTSAVVAATTAFAAKLHAQLSTATGNLFYSPYGVSLNMAELDSAGAQPGVTHALGFTLPTTRRNEAFDALDLDLTAITGKTEHGTGLQFEEATAAWGGLAGGTALARYYGASTLGGKNPAAALSAWESSAAPGPALPVALIGACDGFLATLLHFDATWETPFDPSATAMASFVRADGSKVTAPFMNEQVVLSVDATGATPAVELPYDGGRLSMVIVMPGDLTSFESKLSADAIDAVLSSLSPTLVQLSLPRFSTTYAWSVLPVLEKMGAKLGGGGEWNVAQTSDIAVSELGTVATSTTVTSHSPAAAVMPVVFTVDHPFDYFIRDRTTGTILFVGRTADPTAAH